MSARSDVRRAKRGTTRMGVLDLFALVIGICLAILAVLALATSLASLRLSERQVQSMQYIYEVDSAAERFEAELDRSLERLELRAVAPDGIYGTLRDEMPSIVAEVSKESDWILVEARPVNLDEMASLLGRDSDESLIRKYVTGVHAKLTSESGYVVDCVYGIADTHGYDVLMWNSTKAWDESAQNEQLWQG